MSKKLNIYKFKARNDDKIVVDIAGIASDINVATDEHVGLVKADGETTIMNEDGSISSTNTIRYDISQNLTAEQKAQARSNIGSNENEFSGSYNDLLDKPNLDDYMTEDKLENYLDSENFDNILNEKISIPIASENTPGIVQVGTGINVEDGIINIPVATTTVPGIVKPDDNSIKITSDGKLFVNSSNLDINLTNGIPEGSLNQINSLVHANNLPTINIDECDFTNISSGVYNIIKSNDYRGVYRLLDLSYTDSDDPELRNLRNTDIWQYISDSGIGLFLDLPEYYSKCTDKAMNSAAFGIQNIVHGQNSLAEGSRNIVYGMESHAEGCSNTVYCRQGHAEGYNTVVGTQEAYDLDSTDEDGVSSNIHSCHAEGDSTIASGTKSHAEGARSKAIGGVSHAEGADTQAIGDYSHAEGDHTEASGINTHAEGYLTIASGKYAHSQNMQTVAGGNASSAIGKKTSANASYSDASGYNTIASTRMQSVVGTLNVPDNITASGRVYDLSTATIWKPTGLNNTGSYSKYDIVKFINKYYICNIAHEATNIDGEITPIPYYRGNTQGLTEFWVPLEDRTGKYHFIVGNGTEDTSGNVNRSNAFAVGTDGTTYCNKSSTSGADYAEFFEWLDGNPNNEDRIGYFVTLTNDKIQLATADSDVIGVISGNPGVIGDSYDSEWAEKYIKDIYGRIQYEEYISVDNEIHYRPILNPNYDSTKTYVSRKDRPEWDIVGFLGKLVVIDDGTCIAGAKCSCNSNGIATLGDKYRVLKRLDDNHIQILANFL